MTPSNRKLIFGWAIIYLNVGALGLDVVVVGRDGLSAGVLFCAAMSAFGIFCGVMTIKTRNDRRFSIDQTIKRTK